MSRCETLKEVLDGFLKGSGLEEKAGQIKVEAYRFDPDSQHLFLSLTVPSLLTDAEKEQLAMAFGLKAGAILDVEIEQQLEEEKSSDAGIKGTEEERRQAIIQAAKHSNLMDGAAVCKARFSFEPGRVVLYVPASRVRFLQNEENLIHAMEEADQRLGGAGKVQFEEETEEKERPKQAVGAGSGEAFLQEEENQPGGVMMNPDISGAPEDDIPWEMDGVETGEEGKAAGNVKSVAAQGAGIKSEKTGSEESKSQAAKSTAALSTSRKKPGNKVLTGKPINTKDEISLSSCDVERRMVVTRGIVTQVGIRPIKNEKGILTFRLTNYVDTILVKAFVVMKTYEKRIEKELVKGATVLVKGSLEMDKYLEDLVLTANSITVCAQPMKIDEEKKKELDKMILGRPFTGVASCICDLLKGGQPGKVIVQGDIITKTEKELRNERTLVTIDITDYTDAITVKAFFDNEDYERKAGLLKKGKQIKVLGLLNFDDRFSHEYEITADSIEPTSDLLKPQRLDTGEEKRVELHAHTKISEMDAVIDPKQLVKQAHQWGHKAVAITDHGVVQGFPSAMDAVEELRKNGSDMKVIYGMEAYLVDDETRAVVRDHGQRVDDTTYVVFDIETTGFDKKNDRILEIGAVKVKDGAVVDRFSHFVDPEMPIPPEITRLTSITDDDVAGQGSIREVLPQFLSFTQEAVVVAHNASFDTGFIARKCEELNLPAPDNTIMDTLEISRGLFDLRRYTLDAVAKHLSVSLENHHRAVDDAEATAHIFLKCLKILRDNGITALSQVNPYIHEHTDVKRLRTHHAIILVKNLKGLRNLYELVSLSHLKYFYRQPRIPKSEVNRLREGLLVGSACSAGELYEALLENDTEETVDRLIQFYDYLEIQPIGNNRYLIDDTEHRTVTSDEDLRDINRRIVALGKKYGKRVAATSDAHFMNPEDGIYRKILLHSMDYKDVDKQPDLSLKTTNEMMREFSYLGEEDCRKVVIDNPNAIADEIEHFLPVPTGRFSPVIEGADEELKKVCYDKAKSMYGDPLPDIVQERLDRELDCIIKYGFATLYILARRLVQHSVADGYYVGSRGSVGSSFAATMAGITEINPLKAHYYCPNCHFSDFDPPEARGKAGMSGFDLPHRKCPKCGTELVRDGQEIPFEVFLGFKGDKEPDIDLNFSGEYQPRAHAYVEEMFGKDHVFRAGTMGGLAEKTAYGMVRHYLDDHHETKSNAEINFLVNGCLDVKRTTGQHPGGQIIVPKGYSVYDFTPVQHPANDMTTDIVTTHYDYDQLHGRLLKLDILGHDDPTMIRMLEDMTHTKATEVPIDDPGVMSLFLGTEALGVTPEQIGSPVGTFGISEFGTHFVRQMLVETKPKSFSDLCRISGLSHGTNVWNNNAKDLVDSGTATISECICTREDIMIDLIHLGMDKSQAFHIMEVVRKGKKSGGLKQDDIDAMIAHGVPEWYLESCKKIQYLFPKGHAAAYVTMSLRIAYYKVHYKECYYAAYFTIRADSFDYELMAMGEEKARAAKEELEERSMTDWSAKEKEIHTLLELVVEFYARGCQFLPIDLAASDSHKFQVVDGKLLPPFDAISGMGRNAADSIVAARRDGEFITVADFLERTKVSRTTADTMKKLGILNLPETDQLSLF